MDINELILSIKQNQAELMTSYCIVNGAIIIAMQ